MPGGIRINAIKLMLSVAVFATLMAVGAAYDPSEDGYQATYGDQSAGMGSDYLASYGHGDDHRDDGRHDGRHDDRHDWLPTGHTYYTYPKYSYSSWYYPTYTYTYYPTYYYYTTPVYNSWYYEPVTYDPWWAANVYGVGGTTYYSGSWSWSSHSGGYWF